MLHLKKTWIKTIDKKIYKILSSSISRKKYVIHKATIIQRNYNLKGHEMSHKVTFIFRKYTFS